MKVPLSWLNEYVDVSALSLAELSDKLTFSGIEVEGIERVGADLDEHFVVGEIISCEKHANSDHLHLCQVSDGTEVFQVVCGAPNARAGLKVAFARIGALIPEGGFTIKKARLRGVDSFGMLCSGRELQLSDEAEGILELEADLVPGRLLREVLPAPEVVFDLEVTWNRPDCLSMIGIARELAALMGAELKLPQPHFEENGAPAQECTSVTVVEPELCPRYTARVLRGVGDMPAPAWMRRRLELSGVRPHSLSIDVTNYVMLECGQPLHAFDYRKLSGHRVVVRRARAGELIRTLDGIERQLDEEMLVIADGEKAIALAGIMGGADSEITAGSEYILLESALFDAPATKRTAVKLGLGSESSRRFERGVDPDLAQWASDRATALLVELGGGEVAPGMIDIDNRESSSTEINLTYARANEIIGIDLPPSGMIAILTSLGLEPTGGNDAQGTFRIPSWRQDLRLEADLIEEIARSNGLAAIPAQMPDATAVSLLDNAHFKGQGLIRQLLLGMGFSEAMHYSFLSAQELDSFDGRAPERRFKLPNPVSGDFGVLRDTLLPQLAASLGRNFSRQVESAALFEIGRVFGSDANNHPFEREHLALGMMGPLGRGALEKRKPLGNEEALLWLKGVIETLLERLKLGVPQFKSVEHPAMETGWALEISLKGAPLGIMGLLAGTMRHRWRMTTPMPLAELQLAPLLQPAAAAGTVKPLPHFPGVRRDLAFVVDTAITHQQILAVFNKSAPAELTKVTLFDIFKSKEIGNRKRSMAYCLEFRSPERTLTDQEVNAACAKIILALKRDLQAEVREG